ncbi:MAG: molybdopterin-dependent oxidoreductase [Burkholderiaceae bacterium]|nr:molybdopterin-dependent oxidoreductase [Burkholderiaceae bacterium]
MNKKVGVLRYLGVIGLVLTLPVAWASAPTDARDNDIILTVAGQIQPAGPLQFSLQALQALPHREITTSTAVTDGVFRFQGVLLRDLLDSVSAKGEIIEAEATNGYSTDIPWVDTQSFDVLVAWAVDGVLLDPSDKGPLWIVYPRDQFRELQDIRYDYRWVWLLNRLTIK